MAWRRAFPRPGRTRARALVAQKELSGKGMGECDRPSSPCRLARSACRRCQLPRQASRATPGTAGCVGGATAAPWGQGVQPAAPQGAPGPRRAALRRGSQAPVCVTQPARVPTVQGDRRSPAPQAGSPQAAGGAWGAQPGAQAAGAGNPVESEPQATDRRRSRSRCSVQRNGSPGFPRLGCRASGVQGVGARIQRMRAPSRGKSRG